MGKGPWLASLAPGGIVVLAADEGVPQVPEFSSAWLPGVTLEETGLSASHPRATWRANNRAKLTRGSDPAGSRGPRGIDWPTASKAATPDRSTSWRFGCTDVCPRSSDGLARPEAGNALEDARRAMTDDLEPRRVGLCWPTVASAATKSN
jgi:hypothetical protein